MLRICALWLAAACLLVGQEAAALTVGNSSPKVLVYQPSPTRVVVYDARAELGLAVDSLDRTMLETVSELGVRMARVSLRWDKMEVTEQPGVYLNTYLNEWDALVGACRDAGIYLVVSIDGEPPGIAGDSPASLGRLALFAADMAARYPSVMFWEPFGNSLDSASMLGGKEKTASDKGKAMAGALEVVAPAIRAANPAAWIICPVRDASMLQAVYEAGAQGHFDIPDLQISSPPDQDAFSRMGAHLSKLMVDFSDERRPIWVTVGAAEPFQAQPYEALFEKNNSANLFQKVFVRCDSLEPAALTDWLRASGANSVLFDKPRAAANVRVSTDRPMAASGYDYKIVDGGIEIQRVQISPLAPTRIDLLFLPAAPAQQAPGSSPAPPQKTGTRPIPDPWSP